MLTKSVLNTIDPSNNNGPYDRKVISMLYSGKFRYSVYQCPFNTLATYGIGELLSIYSICILIG